MPMPDTPTHCPVCNLPLREERTSVGIFWACDHCVGRAVSVELLRRIFTPASINPLWLRTINGQGKTGLRCPICRNAMLEVQLSDKAEVKVDVCRHCHFVWFDAGETENLIPRPVPAPEPQLPQKARETIALFKVEQLAERAKNDALEPALPELWWVEIARFLGMHI
ncbi:MAG: hypothetical protein QOG67_211 [Verrucomicrobiota bacterium]